MKVQAKHGKVTQNMHGASRNYRYVWDVSLAGRSREEEEAVQSDLLRLEDPVVQTNNPFWMDRACARVFAVLRMRVERVPRALEYCRGVFGRIFAEFYPLDHVPSSLEKLCRMFSQPADLRHVVNHQIYAGARCAFAFVHSHWPGVDIMLAKAHRAPA